MGDASLEFDRLTSQFLNSLGGKSPRTFTTYQTGLHQFRDFLDARGQLEKWQPSQVESTLLEEFYGWLVRQRGRERRATVATYSAGVRAFMRFLARRAQLPPEVTYEQMRENVAAVMGRGSYKTPRIDRRLPMLVTHVLNLAEPAPTARKGIKRLELLRDRALLLTLFCTGMRRDEVARLDRLDVEDGGSDRALITGKGEKERVVFFDPQTQAAISAYLAARNDTLPPLFLRHDHRRGKTAGHGGERRRLGPQSVWATVKRYARELGGPSTTRHCDHPHD